MTKEEAEQRIQEIRKEVAALQDEEKELKKQVIEMSRSEDTRVYLEDIYHLSEEDAMRVRLSHNMKSTPVMEKFYHSDKRFLVFQKAFYSKTAALGWIDISLVVKIGTSKVDVIDDGLTMTNLKEACGAYLSTNVFTEQDRLYSLVAEMLAAANKASETEKIIPFEHPVRLGGQTFKDQRGFGSEYNGRTLIKQGRQYGETTGFYIIGIVVE